MDNQQLRDLAQNLLTTLPSVVPEGPRRTAVSNEISSALEQADIDVLRDALGRDPDVRAWLQKQNISTDRFTSLGGDPTSRRDVMYRCPDDGFEDTLDTTPQEPPPCPECGISMTRVEG